MSNQTKGKPAVAGRPTLRESFLRKLEELSSGQQKSISNATLRDALGWKEDRYNRVKEDLHREKFITVGRGYGGTVFLAAAPGSKALTLFISYAHEDEEIKKALEKHLSPLKRSKIIEVWHDRLLKAGDDFGQEIDARLEQADIVLLLISVDFLDSDYCDGYELEKAMELHDEGSAVVIPIILRSCLWQHSQFAKLLALPPDGKAVQAWADRDEALMTVAAGIRAKALEILERK